MSEHMGMDARSVTSSVTDLVHGVHDGHRLGELESEESRSCLAPLRSGRIFAGRKKTETLRIRPGTGGVAADPEILYGCCNMLQFLGILVHRSPARSAESSIRRRQILRSGWKRSKL